MSFSSPVASYSLDTPETSETTGTPVSDLTDIMDERLPEPIRSQMAAMMLQRDLETERNRADRMRTDSNTLYELRGWLRLCDDNPDGHTEFYRWACHYIFGDEAPGEEHQ